MANELVGAAELMTNILWLTVESFQKLWHLIGFHPAHEDGSFCLVCNSQKPFDIASLVEFDLRLHHHIVGFVNEYNLWYFRRKSIVRAHSNLS